VPESFFTDPLMYQAVSDGFLGPRDPIAMADPEWGIDFESEIGVICDDVTMGASPDECADRIQLVTILNDVSLRNLIPGELAKGFGFLQSKPRSALAPVFATPDELGRRVDALSSALTEDDGAILRDVELTRTEDGGYAFTATAGIDPPRVLGSLPLDEGAVRFDGEDLAAALEDAGDELARADLRVTFPTVPVADGATVDTTAASWSLPVHELATVSATAPSLPFDRRLALLIAAGVGAFVLVAFAARVIRRR